MDEETQGLTKSGNQRRHVGSYFEGTSKPPAFLRYFSVWNVLKTGGALYLIFVIANGRSDEITNLYKSQSACSPCLDVAINFQKQSIAKAVDFGSCQQYFTGSNQKFQSASDNLMLSDNIMRMSFVPWFQIIVFSLMGVIGFVGLILLYVAFTAGNSAHFEDQTKVFVTNFFASVLTSMFITWFVNVLYFDTVQSSCYVTVIAPIFSFISTVATLAIIFIGIIWVATRNSFVGVICAMSVGFYSAFQGYISVQCYLVAHFWPPVVAFAICMFNIFELPCSYYIMTSDHQKRDDDGVGGYRGVDEDY